LDTSSKGSRDTIYFASDFHLGAPDYDASLIRERKIVKWLDSRNHDMWIFDYLPSEIGAVLYRDPIEIERQGKKLYIGHGDGLGPGDKAYKMLKKVFNNRICQWLFARLHPNFGIWLADHSSKSSRAKTGDKDAIFLGDENEWLVIYSKEILKNHYHDYFIFGHRHLPLEIKLNETSTYVNLGDWINHFTYGVLKDGQLTLEKLKS